MAVTALLLPASACRSAWHCSESFIHTSSFNLHRYYNIQMNKPQHREGEWLPRSHTTRVSTIRCVYFWTLRYFYLKALPRVPWLSHSNLSLDVTYFGKLLQHISSSVLSPPASVWVGTFSNKLWFRESQALFLWGEIISHKGQSLPGVSLERAFLPAPEEDHQSVEEPLPSLTWVNILWSRREG